MKTAWQLGKESVAKKINDPAKDAELLKMITPGMCQSDKWILIDAWELGRADTISKQVA